LVQHEQTEDPYYLLAEKIAYKINSWLQVITGGGLHYGSG
jgi:hypothetical protein